MSDGGAAVIGEGVKGAIALTKFKVGRVVLWAAVAWLLLTAVTAQAGSQMLLFFVAIAVALMALAGGFLAERRKRAERAALKSALLLIGFTLISIVGAVWLLFRRKEDLELPPPSEQEVEALVAD